MLDLSQGAAARLKAAEAHLDDALEHALDLQMGDADDFDGVAPLKLVAPACRS